MQIPLDLILYLLLLQSLPIALRLEAIGGDREQTKKFVLSSQIVLVGLFWLVWGGYSIDAWRYLSGFDRNPLGFKEEQLFWLIGHGLSAMVVHPWAMKLMCMAAAVAYCSAIIIFFRRKSLSLAVIAISLALLMPGYFLMFGNAIRQGLAAAVMIFALLCLNRNRYLLFAVLAAAAFFLHQTALVLCVVLLATRLPISFLKYGLLIAPFISFGIGPVLNVIGVDVDGLIPYAVKNQGVFHYEKFVITYGLAWLVFFLARRLPNADQGVALSYPWMVAASATLLRYEVPFERLLMFSDPLLPFALPLVLASIDRIKRLIVPIWVAGLIAGVTLWSHPSIMTALGYH